MGQKANPTSLRIGSKKNWKTEFSEKTGRDLGRVFNSESQILKFVKKVLSQNGFILQDFRIQHCNNTLHIFLSLNSVEIYKNRIKQTYTIEKKKSLLSEQKVLVYKNKKDLKPLAKTLSNCLGAFSNKKVVVSFSLSNKQINLNNSEKTKLKKKVLSLRKFINRQPHYFFDTLDISNSLSKNINFAESLLGILTTVVKKTKLVKPFLRFLKKSLTLLLDNPTCTTKGVKIKISGKINGARRAKSLRFVVGDVACHSQNKNLEYLSKTTQNENGSYGLKLWVVNHDKIN